MSPDPRDEFVSRVGDNLGAFWETGGLKFSRSCIILTHLYPRFPDSPKLYTTSPLSPLKRQSIKIQKLSPSSLKSNGLALSSALTTFVNFDRPCLSQSSPYVKRPLSPPPGALSGPLTSANLIMRSRHWPAYLCVQPQMARLNNAWCRSAQPSISSSVRTLFTVFIPNDSGPGCEIKAVSVT
ncbi:hypothetical protein RRG08_023846 [Elysia crispata]|uniref:Uncharacterized protein n=1 Tax=Elysia crispata TaxID=231223 RepID=A0AAE1E5G1_9GAST|nr:hypothetical protein RRG08_023846 [Elysia crispata]